MADDVANVDIIKCVALVYKLGAAPKDFIRKEKVCIKLPRSLYFYFYNSLETSRAIFVFVNSPLDVKAFLIAGYCMEL